MNLGYHIYVCPMSYILGTSFWATWRLWVTWHLQYSVSSMLLFLETVSLYLSCSQALLLVITFKKIRYSLNKREQCSFDGCWYNITLFIRHTACNFFQRTWQRHELWRKKNVVARRDDDSHSWICHSVLSLTVFRTM